MQALALLEHLSDRDLEFLLPGGAAVLRRNPDFLSAALDNPELFQRLAHDAEALLHVSPYLLFAVLVRRAARDLRQARFTVERTGLRQRLPVFDAAQVQGLLTEPDVEDYLVELLASFTRVYSGTTWRRTERGLRRRRFSELDLASLEALEAEAGDVERFHLQRRMGDLALFLSGVFPDAAARASLHGRSVEELELAGADRYGRAARHPLAARAGVAAVLSALAGRFRLARKALNFLTDRYLYPFRADWFPAA